MARHAQIWSDMHGYRRVGYFPGLWPAPGMQLAGCSLGYLRCFQILGVELPDSGSETNVGEMGGGEDGAGAGRGGMWIMLYSKLTHQPILCPTLVIKVVFLGSGTFGWVGIFQGCCEARASITCVEN